MVSIQLPDIRGEHTQTRNTVKETQREDKETTGGLDRTTGISDLGEFDLVVEVLSSQFSLKQVVGTAAGSSTDASSSSEMFSERRVCIEQNIFVF